MTKISTATKEQNDFFIEYINKRWKQLHGLEKERFDKSFNLLFVINSGGAVGILSFIGNNLKQGILIAFSIKASLICFLIGIFLVCALMAINYHTVDKLFSSWREDSNNFLKDQIDWDTLIENDNTRAGKGMWLEMTCAYGSFIFFAVGAIVGIMSLLAGK